MNFLAAHLDDIRQRLFDDLRRCADELGPRQRRMYHDGIWCGYMNALTPQSPHCVATENEMFEWYGRAIDYIERWKLLDDERQNGS